MIFRILKFPTVSCVHKQVRWSIKLLFDGIFTQQYLYQKWLESDNYCWNYRWWLGGILFLRHSVYLKQKWAHHTCSNLPQWIASIHSNSDLKKSTVQSIIGRPLQVTVRPMLRYRCSVCPVCLSVTLVYRDQTVGWIKMLLGTEVGLGPDDFVLDGDPAPPRKAAQQPLTFRPTLL